ncbi:MAG: transporter substrate-binding domain-containing protein [Parabacteroides sp.]|nr:transporter substrate-binding domain-containing protein [Parabacteroides sp.]
MAHLLKQYTLAILLALTCFGSFPAAAIVSSPKIIIKADKDYPPYTFINDRGEADGFNVEMTKAIMRELDLPYEIILDNWGTVIEEFERGEIDIVPTMMYTDERAAKYNFGITHSLVYINAVCRKGDHSITDRNSLKDKKIIVQKGDISYEQLMKQGYEKNLLLVDNLIDGIEMLENGEGDVALFCRDAARIAIEKSDSKNLDIIDIGIPPQEFCFAGKDPRLLSQIDVAIGKLKMNGIYDRLYNKWLSTERIKSERLKWLYLGIAISSGIIIIAFLFILILRRMVRKAKKRLEITAKQYLKLYQESNSILNNIPVSVAVYDKDGRQVYVNESTYTMFGVVDIEAHKAKHISIFEDPIIPDKMKEEIRRGEDIYAVLKYDLAQVEKEKYFDTDNTKSVLFLEAKVRYVKGPNKNVEKIIIIINDITSKYIYEEQLNENISKTEYAIRTSNLAYWEYDPITKEFFTINEPIAGYDSNRKLTLDDYQVMLHPDDLEKVIPVETLLAERRDESFSVNVRSKEPGNDKWCYYTLSGVPFKTDQEGKVIKYVGFKKNNTDLIELRQEKMNAEESDRLKSLFLASMSHEIRTPLNAIVGFSELLYETNDKAEQAEFLTIIKHNNELLLRLINDILDMSKLEAGSVKLTPVEFDLAQAFEETATTLRLKCTSPKVKLTVRNPYQTCIVKQDKSRVLQIVINFVTNAIKYTPEGDILMGYEYENGGIKIYVKDEGIGISEKNLPRVFHRFEKLDTFAQGTGLGLSICKAITDKMGGKIGVQSQEGKGSFFWAWLPCDAKIS